MQNELRKRAKEVRSYLKSLEDIEKKFSTPGRKFYRANETIAASKGAVFIMIYNFVENCLRSSIVAIRQDIHAGNYKFDEITDFWQRDFMRANFNEKLSNGTNHAEFIVDFLKATKDQVDWSNPSIKLPFSGNLDQKAIMRLSNEIKCNWTPPRETLGGQYLDIVKKNRNDLSHGVETFKDVGMSVDISKLIVELDRIRKFLLSLTNRLDIYRTRKEYIRRSK
ncbi:MAE_28990/MAE_18760 family HEPN-like nuclease [Acidiphilium sp. PA]|nr:MAE_28990/MAE_18760 family HEPN-like nuclease [Acidiphilium sp. PA]